MGRLPRRAGTQARLSKRGVCGQNPQATCSKATKLGKYSAKSNSNPVPTGMAEGGALHHIISAPAREKWLRVVLVCLQETGQWSPQPQHCWGAQCRLRNR